MEWNWFASSSVDQKVVYRSHQSLKILKLDSATSPQGKPGIPLVACLTKHSTWRFSGFLGVVTTEVMDWEGKALPFGVGLSPPPKMRTWGPYCRGRGYQVFHINLSKNTFFIAMFSFLSFPFHSPIPQRSSRPLYIGPRAWHGANF